MQCEHTIASRHQGKMACPNLALSIFSFNLYEMLQYLQNTWREDSRARVQEGCDALEERGGAS